MMTLRQLATEPPTVPTRTAWYLADLGEARGKQELFTRQSPQKLQLLREHALIESAVSSILTQACKEFEQRVGQLKSPRGEKTALIEEAIARQAGRFSLSDLQSACPGVSVDLIRSVLKRLKGASIECLGRGHTAKWRKTAKQVITCLIG